MTPHVRVLTGVQAGLIVPLTRASLSFGRHAEMDIRFDPQEELQVSARHARIEEIHGQWYVSDLGSTNGTLLNGSPVVNAAALRAGDRIQLGREGPTLEFFLSSRRARPWQPPRVAAAAGLVALGALSVFLSARHRASSWQRERADLERRTDSVIAAGQNTVRALEGQLDELAGALRRSESAVNTARSALANAEARGDDEQTRELRHQLQLATTALTRQQLAAALDFRAIQAVNRKAVARLYVEDESGVVATATAFAVRSDGTLLTSRHVLTGPADRGRPHRIAIQFSDSEQIWPARLVAASLDTDLALVKVDNIVGAVPVVRALNSNADTLAGMPVALIGFPLGGSRQPTRSGLTPIARPLVSAGIIIAVRADRIEVEGYGAAGASGSPIFDGTGAVVGVLSGSIRAATPATLVVAPIGRAAELLSNNR